MGVALLTSVSASLYSAGMKLSDWLKQEPGRTAQLAQALGLRNPRNPALISQWSTGIRDVPVERCVAIEKFSDGAVRRWDLRPDDWHEIWPELVGHPHAPRLRRAAA